MCVLCVLSCPSHSAIVAMSTPLARSSIALVCRSVCGVIRLVFGDGRLAAVWGSVGAQRRGRESCLAEFGAGVSARRGGRVWWLVGVWRVWSGGGGNRSDAGERLGEVLLPGPACGEVERPLAGVAGEAAGEREQPAADGACGADGGVGEPELFGPAQQIVREARDHGPGAVGVELSRGEVFERLVLPVV